MQASARGLSLAELATTATILAVRFQGSFAVALVPAVGIAVEEGSLAVFKPGVFKLQMGRAIAQAGQSGFIVLAATQLSGGFQAAASLVTGPLWVLIIGRVVKTGPKVGRAAWLGVVGYGACAVLLMSNASVGSGNIIIGVVCLLGSGACTASLQFLTRAAADERKLTATLWQNGPAALLCLPLWWYGIAGGPAASMPIDVMGYVLLASMVACSLAQQVALQVAYGWSKDTPVAQLNSLRGAQVWVGTLLDRVCFGVVPNAVNLLSIPVVGIAIATGWIAGRPKKK